MSRRTRLAVRLRHRPPRRNRSDRRLGRQLREILAGVPDDIATRLRHGEPLPWDQPDATPSADIAATAERHPWAAG
jgi:hypothetical protein